MLMLFHITEYEQKVSFQSSDSDLWENVSDLCNDTKVTEALEWQSYLHSTMQSL